ncbi:MAG: CotH kinase family protein [Chitinivibrionia bacterium]|nr:CotH kinase family protein [Chitinivibrionia bacterium]
MNGKMKILKTFTRAFYVAGIFLFVSCSQFNNEVPQKLFGLPHIAIEMREDDFADLRKNALVNEYAAITIEKDGVKKTGKIRRRGNSSRYYPKPSFHIKTDEGDWHYVAQNADKSYCREVFANIIFEKDGDFLVPKTHFVALSINNVYQGLYISREPIDEKFFERRNVKINSLYRITMSGAFTFKDGRNSSMSFEKLIPQSSINYDDLNILISALDENDKERIKKILNIDNVAKYSFMCSSIYHIDGITNNIHICNTKNDGKFQIIPYDLDFTFGNTREDGFVIPTNFPKFENGLLEKAEDIYLSENDSITGKLLKREDVVFNTLHNIDNIIEILDSLKNEFSQAYKFDPYIQGENLGEHIAEIKTYIRTKLNKF